jgi:hypothetical protein
VSPLSNSKEDGSFRLIVSRKGRQAQGFTAVKMNATEDLGWLDSPSNSTLQWRDVRL